MYSIRVDGKLLYSPSLAEEGFLVSNPKLTLELGRSGSLTFLLPPNNPMYDSIQKLKSIITVFDGSEEIFRGRVLHDEKDFLNRKDVYCEGELSFLLDSIQRPYSFTGDIPDLFRQFIESHNAQVDEEKQFIVGEVTVTDPNNYINRSNVHYGNTLDAITDQIISTHGGYIRPRLTNGKRYIDLVVDYGKTNSQVIEFGKNILDISEYITAENVFTVLIPLGADLNAGSSSGSSGGIIYSPTCSSCDRSMIVDTEASEAGDYWVYVCPGCGAEVKKAKNTSTGSSSVESGDGESVNLLTIESVNDGKDYIEDDAGIALFGRICRTHEWPDVTEAENLLNKGRAFLDASIEMAVTLTMNAVDLHLVDVDTERIGLGDYVQVISPPHNLDRAFLCSKIVIDMVNPENSEYTLGVTYSTMTEKQVEGTKVIQSTANTVNQAAQTVQNAVNVMETDYVKSTVYSEDMTQSGIFKILTNNGQIQGMVYDKATGNVYINASYIKSGTLTIGGLHSDSSKLEILDSTGEVCVTAGSSGIKVLKGDINATSGSLDRVTIVDGITISTKDEAIKDLSLISIEPYDNGAGTEYRIIFGEATTRSTPIAIEGSSITLKGTSALTFSADNIIFENAIEAPSAYFEDVHLQNALNFDLGDAEKQIHFKNQTNSGTYPHNAKIYGGNAASKIAVGVYDLNNGKRIFAYDDQAQHVVSDVKLASYDLEIELEAGASSVDNRSICQQLTRAAHLHTIFTTTDIAANATATLGSISTDYAPIGFDVILSAYTATTACSVFLTSKGYIKIKAPNAIAAGSKIYIDGCWIY